MLLVQPDSLSPNDQSLLEQARRAAQTSTATYSKFRVGAALRIRTPQGEERVVTGNNFETANYYSVCAEKHALMRAYSEHSHIHPDGSIRRPAILEVAVFCATGGEPQQPCGDCRQTLHGANPNMRVLAFAGERPTPDGIEYDPRVSVTSLQHLLPHSFELTPSIPPNEDLDARIHDSQDPAEYVVHLPHPEHLKHDRDARVESLVGVEYLILVGSPVRARKVAEAARDLYNASIECYSDLSIPQRDEAKREYAVHTIEMPQGQRIAVVSHGIGLSGVEIVLSEVPALITLAQRGRPAHIRGVIRCGTRGTLERVPLGCIAISTASCDDSLHTLQPDPVWTQLLRDASTRRSMHLIAEDDIAHFNEDTNPWPSPPQNVVVEGLGLSSTFFWRGQGRPIYRPNLDKITKHHDQKNRLKLLESWVQFGIRWIEMEDYSVHAICTMCGYPSASLGAVIAHRRTSQGRYQLDYSQEMYQRSEMIPAYIALDAILLHSTT